MATEKPGTILVAEDTKSLREIVAFTLRGRGWNVVESGDGDDALRKAMTLMPNLIVLDVMMPGKTGFEICSTLKSDERYRNIPILIVSAVTQGSGKSDEHWKELSSADAFISKPFRAQQLMQCIEELIEKSARKNAHLPVEE